MNVTDWERLGAFHLDRAVNAESGEEGMRSKVLAQRGYAVGRGSVAGRSGSLADSAS